MATLPAYLETAAVRATFEPDSTWGVRFTELAHLGGAAPFTWRNEPTGIGRDWRLWEARGKLASGADWTAIPSDAAAFEARATTTADGDEALIFCWSDVPIPGATAGDLLEVVLVAFVPATEPAELRWRLCVRRSVGASASIDEIDCPITYWRSPVATRAGSNAMQSARRARVFTPTNFQAVLTTGAPESPLSLWLLGLSFRQAHPHATGLGSNHAANQTVQWCAVCAVDPQDTASYRQILHLGTRDVVGHVKRLVLQGFPTGSVTDGRLGWRVTHIPQWSGYPAHDLEADASELGNVYVSRFPVAMAVAVAKSNAWDYDACDLYRRWANRVGLGGPPRQFATDRAQIRDGRPLLGFILTPEILQGPELYDLFLTEAREFAAVLDGPHSAYPLFQFWSNWMQIPGVVGGKSIMNPGNPVEPWVDEGLVAALEVAHSEGGKVAVYTHGTSHESNRGWAEPGTDVHERDGTPWSTTSHVWDLGNPLAIAKQIEFYAAVAAASHAAGIYTDSVSGGSGFLAYDAPGFPRAHFEHGGSRWARGKRDLFEGIRAGLEAVRGESHEAFVLSENPEEILTGRAAPDATQEGYSYFPGSMPLADESLWGLGVTDVPIQSRPCTPAWWTGCHHRSRPSLRLPFSLSFATLAGAGWHPFGSYTGLTASEVLDQLCYTFGITWLHGVGWMFVQRSEWFDARLFRPGLAGDELTVQTGFAAFLHALYQALHPDWLGMELGFGDLARQLDIVFESDHNADHNADHGGPVSRGTSPLNLSRKCRPDHYIATYPGYHYRYLPALTARIVGPGNDHSLDHNADHGGRAVAAGGEIVRVNGVPNDWSASEEDAILGSGPTAETVRVRSRARDHNADHSEDHGGYLRLGVPDGLGGFLPLQHDHAVWETLVRPETGPGGWRNATSNYPVPKIAHAAFEPLDRSRFAALLLNWSGDAAASWQGEFDSANYPQLGNGWIALRELTAAGTKVDLVLRRPGTTRIHCKPAVAPHRDGPDVHLGAMPARGFRALEVAAIADDHNADHNLDHGPVFSPTLPWSGRNHSGDHNHDHD